MQLAHSVCLVTLIISHLLAAQPHRFSSELWESQSSRMTNTWPNGSLDSLAAVKTERGNAVCGCRTSPESAAEGVLAAGRICVQDESPADISALCPTWHRLSRDQTTGYRRLRVADPAKQETDR